MQKYKDYYKSLDAEGKKDFADRLDTSVPYVYQIYNGQRVPGNKILAKMYEASYGHVEIMDFFPDSIK